jgi:hypothetical protein
MHKTWIEGGVDVESIGFGKYYKIVKLSLVT